MNRLDEITAHKKIELAEAKRNRPVAQLEKALKGRPATRGFERNIRQESALSLIAEFKRASPSAGTIRSDADPARIAQIYADAGARAVSVLTDSKFFSGSLQDLVSARDAVAVPILRKDFILEEYQVVESAAAGADCILLIAAIVEKPVLRRLLGLGRDLKLDALVEVHSEAELDAALEAGASLIGINNRDLKSFVVDLKTTERLAPLIPKDKTAVSESGIRSRANVELIRQLGVQAILVGEELMSSADIGAKIKELMGG